MAKEYWQDKHISEDPDEPTRLICWDEKGEFLCFADDIIDARDKVEKYAETLNLYT